MASKLPAGARQVSDLCLDPEQFLSKLVTCVFGVLGVGVAFPQNHPTRAPQVEGLSCFEGTSGGAVSLPFLLLRALAFGDGGKPTGRAICHFGGARALRDAPIENHPGQAAVARPTTATTSRRCCAGSRGPCPASSPSPRTTAPWSRAR